MAPGVQCRRAAAWSHSAGVPRSVPMTGMRSTAPLCLAYASLSVEEPVLRLYGQLEMGLHAFLPCTYVSDALLMACCFFWASRRHCTGAAQIPIQASLAAGRVKAVLHRVRDGAAGAGGIVPRRDAAIFFVAPDVSAPLETIVREGEVPRYAGLLTHGEFKVLLLR